MLVALLDPIIVRPEGVNLVVALDKCIVSFKGPLKEVPIRATVELWDGARGEHRHGWLNQNRLPLDHRSRLPAEGPAAAHQ